MKKILFISLFIILTIQITIAQTTAKTSFPVVKTANGLIEGTVESSGISSFKGIPFAAPPVGNLRWKEPQPVKNWRGKLQAKQFGPNGMQTQVFGDMGFRSKGMSEDCLYLNVWSPSTSNKGLPVLVYFYGGGFVAGDGSEARYDGESMAKKGIVAVTLNYRLGVFGFLAHPELTKESPHHASGNYGLLDQAAALIWVKQNIAAFGGDPKRVTIAGESAGSISVSAQMISPLSKNLIAGAIGESGSLLGTLPAAPLANNEKTGVEFAKAVGVNTLAELRTISSDKLLEAASKFGPFRFAMSIDGYFFPKDPIKIFEAGEEAHVPLLAGWNSEEMNYRMIMGNENLTKENYIKAVHKLYGENAAQALDVYNPLTDAEVEQVATDLAGDRFISYGTWKWAEIQAKTGGKNVYLYLFSRPRPAMNAAMGNVTAGMAGGVVRDSSTKKATQMVLPKGAVHSAEIEYAMGNLASNKIYNWSKEDYNVSKVMQEYFVNFIKKGNPNGIGVPMWPAINGNSNNNNQFIKIDVNTKVQTDKNRARYLFMDKLAPR